MLKSQKSLSFLLALILLPFSATVPAQTRIDGAELYSQESVSFGRWEIRMKLVSTPGSVSSFFTYFNDSHAGSPVPWREIDIEAIGINPKGFQSNLITGTAQSKVNTVVFHETPTDLSQSFHTYQVDWTPDSIVYRLDGTLLRKISSPDIQVQDLREKPMSYRMNLWASDSPTWTGALDTTKLPALQVVNWMAYSSYTPKQGPGGSDFTPTWIDDFTTLDTLRWARGDWTFDGNLADFMPSNIKVTQGYLVLKLSSKGDSREWNPPQDPNGSSYPSSMIGPFFRDHPNRSQGVHLTPFSARVIYNDFRLPIYTIDGRTPFLKVKEF
jgi:beta-glucanase (GH16 family)